jgi:hypothetical protein
MRMLFDTKSNQTRNSAQLNVLLVTDVHRTPATPALYREGDGKALHPCSIIIAFVNARARVDAGQGRRDEFN